MNGQVGTCVSPGMCCFPDDGCVWSESSDVTEPCRRESASRSACIPDGDICDTVGGICVASQCCNGHGCKPSLRCTVKQMTFRDIDE